MHTWEGWESFKMFLLGEWFSLPMNGRRWQRRRRWRAFIESNSEQRRTDGMTQFPTRRVRVRWVMCVALPRQATRLIRERFKFTAGARFRFSVLWLANEILLWFVAWQIGRMNTTTDAGFRKDLNAAILSGFEIFYTNLSSKARDVLIGLVVSI